MSHFSRDRGPSAEKTEHVNKTMLAVCSLFVLEGKKKKRREEKEPKKAPNQFMVPSSSAQHSKIN